MYCQLSHQPRLPTQAKLEAEIAALKASQPPSAHAAAAAVEATCRLQEALMQREKELEGETVFRGVLRCRGAVTHRCWLV